MRRYQSLGLLRKNHVRRRPGQSGNDAERFVSAEHVKDLILYSRLARSRPEIRTLQFANDDVDWQWEYFCVALGKLFTKLIGWFLWLFQLLIRILPKRCRKWRGYRDKHDSDDNNFNCPKQLQTDNSTTAIVKLPVSMNKDSISKSWKFRNCQPIANRRFIKRKWFCKPETKEWAEETRQEFQRQVNRSFRSLCSGAGKDTKIYVVRLTALSNSRSTPAINNCIFAADSSKLKMMSELFRNWYEQSGNKKQIETSFITADEMEALLVYIYTRTWPKSMVKEGRGLQERFYQILDIYGVPLKLSREVPFRDFNEQLGPYDRSCVLEDILFDSFFHFNFNKVPDPPLINYVDEKGDFVHFKNELEDLKYSNIISSPPSKAVRHVRKSFLEKFTLPSRSPRVHPESAFEPKLDIPLIVTSTPRKSHTNCSIEAE